jgi:hypothetical protein
MRLLLLLLLLTVAVAFGWCSIADVELTGLARARSGSSQVNRQKWGGSFCELVLLMRLCII